MNCLYIISVFHRAFFNSIIDEYQHMQVLVFINYCLYITLFFNIVAAIVQRFIKPWKQLLYLRVIEVCRLPFEPRHDFFLHLIFVVELFPSEMFLSSSHFANS